MVGSPVATAAAVTLTRSNMSPDPDGPAIHGQRRKRTNLTMQDASATIGEYRLHETDTGSPEVQIALLTEPDQHAHGAPEDP